MTRALLLRGVSASMLALALAPTAAPAQQSLPTIDIGAARASRAGLTQAAPSRAPSGVGGPAGLAATRPLAEQNDTYRPANTTTALKTNTPIMNTPASVQVVPRQVMNDQQVTEISQAVNNVSGVTAADERQGLVPAIWIRGFQTNNYYLDGVRMPSSPTNTNQNMANIDRVEILKGPASILYGRGDPGGLVNLVTKTPLETRYTALQQQFGSWGQFRTTFDTTGPLTEDKSLLYRFNASYETGNDFIDYLHGHNVFIAPKLRWNIDNHTYFDLYMTYQDRGSPFYSSAIPFTGPGPNSSNPLYTWLWGNAGAPSSLLPRSRNFAQPWARTGSQEYIAGFNWSHDFNENWNVRHRFQAQITDFTSLYSGPFLYNDFDGVPFRTDNWAYHIPHISTNSYFTNLDVTGKVETGPAKHTLLFGTDYQHFRLAGHQYYSYPVSFGGPVPPTDNFLPGQRPFSPLDFDLNSRVDYGYHESWWGAYIQDQIELPYDIHILAGGRFDDIKLYDDVSKSVATNAQRVTPRFGLLWRPIPEASVYASYTQSYGNSPTAATRPVKPESAEQWEVGVKTELFDKRLATTFAFYNIVKKNVAVPIDPSGLVFSSLGEVRNKGFEFDIAGDITPGWKVIGNYSYIASEITKDGACDLAAYQLYADSITNFTFDQPLPSSCVVDAYNTFTQFNPTLVSAFGNKGKRNPGVPRHAGSIWSTYEVLDGDFRGLKVGAGVTARSQIFGDLFNSYSLPAYATLNMMAAYETRLFDRKVTFQLNANNLLDTRYYNITNPGYYAIATGTPRNFRGSIKFEF